MSTSRQVVARICIPDGISFADLRLSRDPVTGEVEYDVETVRRVAAASGLAPELLASEDGISSLLVAWYQAARAAGEPPDPVQEDLLSEVQEEDQRGGGLSYPPGTA